MTKKLLARAGEALTALFAFGGGALTEMAPPETTGIYFASGFALMIALILLLFAWTMIDQVRVRKFWLKLASAGFIATVLSAGIYVVAVDSYVYVIDGNEGPVRQVAGTERTTTAQDWWDSQLHPTTVEMVKSLVYPQYIWTKESVSRANYILLGSYLLFVFSFCFTVFSLSEGALSLKEGARPSD